MESSGYPLPRAAYKFNHADTEQSSGSRHRAANGLALQQRAGHWPGSELKIGWDSDLSESHLLKPDSWLPECRKASCYGQEAVLVGRGVCAMTEQVLLGVLAFPRIYTTDPRMYRSMCERNRSGEVYHDMKKVNQSTACTHKLTQSLVLS